MAKFGADIDLRRIWDLGDDLPPAKAGAAPDKPLGHRRARECRDTMRAKARLWIANSPRKAPTMIGALWDECRACGRCIGI